MDDLISRQAAIEKIDLLFREPYSGDFVNTHYNHGVGDAFAIVTNLPSAQPERKTGKWIWMGEKGDSRFMCSVCKSKENVPTCNGEPTIWWFCPNCGAEMKGE